MKKNCYRNEVLYCNTAGKGAELLHNLEIPRGFRILPPKKTIVGKVLYTILRIVGGCAQSTADATPETKAVSPLPLLLWMLGLCRQVFPGE